MAERDFVEISVETPRWKIERLGCSSVIEKRNIAEALLLELAPLLADAFRGRTLDFPSGMARIQLRIEAASDG